MASPAMKRCRTCGREFSPQSFSPNRNRCKDCRKAEAYARKLERRAVARSFITEVNDGTVCAHCDKQPIEWHNPEHAELNRHDRRIGFMVSRGSSIDAIRAELATCIPLCLSCHRKEDGRIERMRQGLRPPQRNTAPCSDCGQPYFPLRRGLCHACNEYQRLNGKPRRPYLESVGRAG